MITREVFYVDSADGIHMIHGYRWYDPEVEYKGVLQLVHGMQEYIERYHGAGGVYGFCRLFCGRT